MTERIAERNYVDGRIEIWKDEYPHPKPWNVLFDNRIREYSGAFISFQDAIAYADKFRKQLQEDKK